MPSIAIRPFSGERLYAEYRGCHLTVTRGRDHLGNYETHVRAYEADSRFSLLYVWGKNEEPLPVLMERLKEYVDRKLDA